MPSSSASGTREIQVSKPTLLSPWFVVTRFRTLSHLGQQEWFTSSEDAEEIWSEDPKKAMLFNSIHSAHRVARAEGAYAVVVANEDDYKEYRNA